MSDVESDPNAWWWNPNVDAKTLQTMLDNNKGRLISLASHFVNGQQRFAGVWVSNTGVQHKVGSWVADEEPAVLGKLLGEKNGRIVSLDAFMVSGKLRVAAVWIENTGKDKQAWWWNPDVDPATLGQMLTNNKGRLVCLRTYLRGNERRFAAVWVENTGSHQKAWWWNPDVDAETLGKMLDDNKGRLVSLEPYVVSGKLRFAGVWVDNTGQGGHTWWWNFGKDEASLGKTFDQFCAYPIDLRFYLHGGTWRIAGVTKSYPPAPNPEGASLVKVSGTATLDSLSDGIAPFDQAMSLHLDVKNPTSASVQITEAELALTMPGGWVEKDSRAPLYGNGRLFAGKPQDLTKGQGYGASKSMGWGGGVSHFLVRLRATSGSQKQYSHTLLPIARAGFDVPAGFTASTPVFIGTWTRPAEIIQLSAAGNATHWVSLGGQLVNGSGKSLRLVRWHLRFTVDGKLLHEADMPMTFKHFVGNDFVELDPPKGGEQTLADVLTYFIYGFEVSKLPKSFSKAEVELVANYKIDGNCGAAVCRMPAVLVDAVTLEPPVKGRFRWGNSPNHTGFDAHAWPGQRFSVDLVQVDEKGSSSKPNPDPSDKTFLQKNENFYAYGEPVFAMKAGKVLKSKDDEDENFGKTENKNKNSINYVLIEHGPNERSGYYHLRKGKNTVVVGQSVVAGQQLGEIGNSGGSSEPHLHIGYVRVAATGGGTLVPMRFNGLKTLGDKEVSGVPATGVYVSGGAPAARMMRLSPEHEEEAGQHETVGVGCDVEKLALAELLGGRG